MSVKWNRRSEDGENVMTTVTPSGVWTVLAIGTSASGKPTTWGVTLNGEFLKSVLRGKEWNKSFSTQKAAMKFVEWRITGVDPGEALRKAEAAKLKAEDEEFEKLAAFPEGQRRIRRLLMEGKITLDDLKKVLADLAS